MNDGEFQWDDTKAAQNFAKHGVSFDAAKRVFEDPFAVEYSDDREDYGEERFIIIGLIETRLVFVAFTMRDEIVRIISARAAEPFERREYHEQNT
ncbi:MAG: BrnT family toxin [Pseudomonadota bacterium]|nr:BrnT family toxin [Pseudomonadota bacterium]